MKRFWLVAVPSLLVVAVLAARGPWVAAQQTPAAAGSPQPAPAPVTVPEIPFDSSTDFLRYSRRHEFRRGARRRRQLEESRWWC